MNGILLYRRETDVNMARFYRLSLGCDLFGQAVLVREWGRIGQGGQKGGQSLTETFPSLAAARTACAALLRAKRRRGYCLLLEAG